MDARPATDADLVDVLGRLCGPHKQELAFLGLDNGESLKLLRDFMRCGLAESGYVNGRPEAVFGVNESDRNWVWFIATDDFFKVGLPAIRFGKRYLREQTERFGPLWARTSSGGDIVMRWLQWFGFKPVQLGEFNTFVYGAA